MDERTNLIGKKVVIIKTDHFIKKGILKELSNNYLILKYERSGLEEVININSVLSIKLSEDVRI